MQRASSSGGVQRPSGPDPGVQRTGCQRDADNLPGQPGAEGLQLRQGGGEGRGLPAGVQSGLHPSDP